MSLGVSIWLYVTLILSTTHRASTLDNLDPAQADPNGQITCLGDSYPHSLPMIGDFDPNRLTMQQICAKPQYHGGPPGQHIGGFCEVTEPLLPMVQSRVVFDVSGNAQVNRILQNQRTILGCTYKCFCNLGVTDLSTQPATYPQPSANGGRWSADPWQAISSNYYTSMYQMAVDRINDYRVPPGPHQGLYGVTRVDTVRLYNANAPFGHSWYPPQYISHDAQNRIECRGALPPFPLPPPYTIDRFADLQELCASRLSGGYPAANAGGYCHRTVAPGAANALIREVWFSDEITPRYEWTWNNFIASLGVRFYCYQRCACTYRPTRRDSTERMWMHPYVKVWRFVNGYDVTQNPDGSLTYGPASASTSSGQILPAPQGATQHSGTCGPNNTDFCPSPWPTALLGPIQQIQVPPDPIA